ncbi:hypothetical protein LO80_08525 [Candidatus Francisella endociliophora]|uniref:Uncharacterized protein n=2 Tax=Candidatus Francisella endociliophora TaxID=653937 RepID=A0A097ER07_9GAMM|nr:hypothetical protein LO80_08525 [Francisella sp. FSC1006]
MFISAISSLLLLPSNYSHIEVFRSLAAYLNALLPFILVINLESKELQRLRKVILWLFYFLVTLGFLQYFHLINFLDPLFKFFIPRASAESLSFMNRGATLLSSEPARAGVELIFMYVVVRYTSIRKTLISDALMLIYILFIIQSAMALGCYMVFLLIIYRLRLVLILAVILLLITQINLHSGGRAIDLVYKVIGSSSIYDSLYMVMNVSGARVISIYSSFIYGIHNIFGGGIGCWKISSVDALNMTGFDVGSMRYFQVHGAGSVVPVRSSGFFSNLMLDVGWLGVLMFSFYLYDKLKVYWKNGTESRNLILYFIFNVCVIGSVGDPTPWIVIALMLRIFDYGRNKV